MRRYIGYALIVVALLTLAVWTISQFVQPILPSNLNNGLILFFAALTGVSGVLASFKDIVELFHSLSEKQGQNDKVLLEDNFITGPVQITYGNVANVTVNVTYIAQSRVFEYSQVASSTFAPEIEVKPAETDFRQVVPREAPPLIPDFTGRATEIMALKSIILRQSKRVGFVDLAGLGGVGKTALVTKLVNDPDIEKAFPDGTLWASGEFDFRETLSCWIHVLHPSLVASDLINDHNQLSTLFGQLTQHRRILIVFDNISKDSAQQIRYLTERIGHECRVLITSRAVNLPGVDTLVSLDVLPEQEALSLLENTIGRELNTGEKSTAREIAFLLGYLPLAIRLAGAYLNHTLISLGDYRDRLRTEIESGKSLDLDEVRERSTSVRNVIEYAHARLSVQEQVRLRALSVFPPSARFDMKVVQAIWQVESSEAKTTLDSLLTTSFLDLSDGQYTMHPLVRLYVREIFEKTSEAERETVWKAYGKYMSESGMSFD